MSDIDLWVDFNDLDREHRTTTLLEFADPTVHIRAGLQLVVGDNEGNTCEATVQSIEGRLVHVVCKLDTFRAGA